jgi:hypothetical protein
MKKTHFLMLLISLFFSCKEQQRYSKNTGKVNNISVIIDDQQWNGEIGTV